MITDQATVLHVQDYSKSSQLVVLLSVKHGLFKGIAKGAKRSTPSMVATFCGGFEYFDQGEIQCTYDAKNEFQTLTSWNLQHNFRHRHHWQVQSTLHLLSTLCQNFFAEHQPQKQLFAHFNDLLQSMDQAAEQLEQPLFFLWQMLKLAGYQLEIQKDIFTHLALSTHALHFFYPHQGGLSIEKHPDKKHFGVHPKRLRVLQHLALHSSLNDWQTTDFARKDIALSIELLLSYTRELLGKTLPGIDFYLDHILKAKD